MGSAADFDFWLGMWRGEWGDDGAHGTNSISKEYDGRVVYERFDGRPGADFTGMSVSVYDEQEDCWRQTWVDDAGNYFHLVGRFEQDEMILLCRERYRMRFFDITPKSFRWTWERRKGEAWELSWEIDYRRLGGTL
jgi:hypothetical protein